MTRSPVSRKDPTGTRRIERREIARQSRIIQAYVEAITRVASGIEDDVNAPAIPFDELRVEKLDHLRQAMQEDLLASTDDWINETSRAAMESTNKVLKNMNTGIQLGTIPVPREEVSIMRESIRHDVITISDRLFNETTQVLLEGYQKGLGAKEVGRMVRDMGGNTQYNAERIIRTESMRICDIVSKTGYELAGCDGYMSFPTDDDRLCPVCRARATGSSTAGGGTPLKIYPLDEPIALPWHPNCRCTRLPHFANDTKVYRL